MAKCPACGQECEHVIHDPLARVQLQLDKLLTPAEQSIQFVMAWAHNHPCPEGNPSAIASRLAKRLRIAVDNAKGAGL